MFGFAGPRVCQGQRTAGMACLGLFKELRQGPPLWTAGWATPWSAPPRESWGCLRPLTPKVLSGDSPHYAVLPSCLWRASGEGLARLFAPHTALDACACQFDLISRSLQTAHLAERHLKTFLTHRCLAAQNVKRGIAEPHTAAAFGDVDQYLA